MGGIFRRTVAFALRLTWRLRWLAPLLMRLFLGYFFLETGWGKMHNLGTFTQRFMEWGIPYPAFNAALSAYTEFIGGVLTLAGLFMRPVSIPMMINMAVAIISVKFKDVQRAQRFRRARRAALRAGIFLADDVGRGRSQPRLFPRTISNLRGWSEAKPDAS